MRTVKILIVWALLLAFVAASPALAAPVKSNKPGGGKGSRAQNPTTPPAPEVPVGPAVPSADAGAFHIQLWDAQKTSWDDAQLRLVADSGFTVVQNGWCGAHIPSQQLLDHIASCGLLYGAYVSTRQLFYDRATAAERAAVLPITAFDGTLNAGDFNTFDPVYQSVVAREMRFEMAQLTDARALLKVMFNSEHGAPVSYDSLTWQRAAAAGIVSAGQKLPYYYRGIVRVPAGESPSLYASQYAFGRWFDTEARDGVINRLAAAIVRTEAPGVLATADPNMDVYAYGQYREMDVLQDWLRVHQAPRDPLSMAYRAERLKAHVRARSGAGRIWIGPQLGTKTSTTQYGAPADIFEEALWLAVAFGANSITCWGYDTIDLSDPLDADTWSRVGKFRDGLETAYPQLIGAVDASRACAVLLSKANLTFTQRAYYEIEDNYERFYRILLTAHVPADVLYDDDVLAGRLSGYSALLLPGIEYLTPELQAAISAFERGGGRVVPYPFANVFYRDYQITRGECSDTVNILSPGGLSLLPHQYRQWRQYHAAKVYALVKDLMAVHCDNPDVIVNTVWSGGVCYVVCINDSRTYGAWTAARGHRWCEDAGLPATATITVGSGTAARRFPISIPAAGITVIPL